MGLKCIQTLKKIRDVLASNSTVDSLIKQQELLLQ